MFWLLDATKTARLEDGAPVTVIVRPADVVVAPSSSRATAVSE